MPLWLHMLAASDPPTGGFDYWAGYGVVGILGFAGITFMWRTYTAANSERLALVVQVGEQQAALLKQAEDHKDELLEVYKAVMPALESATAALKEAARLTEEQRLEARLRGQ